ncbi:hypothetical protein Patl1_32964 [Pistacia atlantica]|uniref:Uncharacterized protein n=1 Tax=Pistacia atlantica TaxID=434234 RepID=A0ACC1ARA7_9ROSI|nr:hypothetical protein Patl1_32964 [Pistacia atlantica]
MVSEPSVANAFINPMAASADSSSSSAAFHLPSQVISIKLDGTNFFAWSAQLLPLFRSYGLMGIVDGSEPSPQFSSTENKARALDAFVRSPFIVQCIVWCLHMIAKVLGCILCVVFPELAQENGAFSEDILRIAFSTTEDGFLTLVHRTRTSNKIVAEQLTRDHSPFVEVRQELKSLHPDDSDIVVLQHGVCVQGVLQVSRTIGVAYFKRPEFLVLLHSSTVYHSVDHHLLGNGIFLPELSIRGRFIDTVGPSNSNIPLVPGPLSEISNLVT